MKLEAIRKRITESDVAFVHDPDGNVHFWKLRSQPAFMHLGVTDATYPTSWRQLKHTWEHDRGGTQYAFPGYDYHVLGGIELPSFEDLCVVTTSYYEGETQYSVNHLVDRYAGSDGTLVVVADEKQFQPEGGLRPLYMEPFCTHVGSYDQVYSAFVDYYHECGWDLPLRDTKNLFLQDNSNLYELVEGKRLESVTDLFDVLADAPYLPLYETFSDIFARKDQFGVAPLESDDTVEALGGWLRRRIEWEKRTASNVAHDLNRLVSLEGTAFDPSYAKRSPKLLEARKVAANLDPEESTISARYRDWLKDPL